MALLFSLVKYSNKYGENTIRVIWSLQGVSLVSTIGISVPAKNWSEKKQRVKGVFENSKGMTEIQINAVITNLEEKLNSWASNVLPRTKINRATLKAVLDDVLSNKDDGIQNEVVNVFEHFDRFMAERGILASWSESTKYKYITTRRHLEQFCPQLNFSQINERLLERYTIFLCEEINMQPVSIVKEHKHLKTFLAWAENENLLNDDNYKRYRYMSTDPGKPIIYLTNDELMALNNFTVPEDGTKMKLYDVNNKPYKIIMHNHNSLEKVKDLFLFSCFTGLRYSDAQALKRHNIVKGEIHITIQKTQRELKIIINEFAQKIINKYKGRVKDDFCLPQISNQKENEYLHRLFEIFGLNDPVTLVQTVGGIKQRNTYARWELLSTHAARRTFVCFALSLGVSPVVVTKFTGHSSLAAMKPYIEISDDTKVKAMSIINEGAKRIEHKLKKL